MLVSLSEIKQEEQFQALVESFHRQFGQDRTIPNVVPGVVRPRNSMIAKLATMGRAMRFDTHRGGNRVPAPVGDHPRVTIVRPGTRAAIGTVVFFNEGSDELSPEAKQALKQTALDLGGKPQRIEVRGHTSLKPLDDNGKTRDLFDLAYRRCRRVIDMLVAMGIDRKRIRIAVAGPNEPLHIGTDPVKMKKNPRVDVYLLDELVDDLEGTAQERERRFDGSPPEK